MLILQSPGFRRSTTDHLFCFQTTGLGLTDRSRFYRAKTKSQSFISAFLPQLKQGILAGERLRLLPVLLFLLFAALTEPADVDLYPWHKHCAHLVCFVYTKTVISSPRPHDCQYFTNGEPVGGQVVRRAADFIFVVPADEVTFLSVACRPVWRYSP